MGYVSPSQTYRMPENSYRGSNGGRNYDAFRGGEVAQSPRSGGFHLFGGHNSNGYGGKAPKAFNYGGGHSGWGGSGGWKAPKESHFGGGATPAAVVIPAAVTSTPPAVTIERLQYLNNGRLQAAVM